MCGIHTCCTMHVSSGRCDAKCVHNAHRYPGCTYLGSYLGFICLWVIHLSLYYSDKHIVLLNRSL